MTRSEHEALTQAQREAFRKNLGTVTEDPDYKEREEARLAALEAGKK